MNHLHKILNLFTKFYPQFSDVQINIDYVNVTTYSISDRNWSNYVEAVTRGVIFFTETISTTALTKTPTMDG